MRYNKTSGYTPNRNSKIVQTHFVFNRFKQWNDDDS